MHKVKCPVCGSSHTMKNGKRNGIQTYKCSDCHYQFRKDKMPSDEEIWRLYQDRKQTVAEIAESLGVSESTVKRRLSCVRREWVHPRLEGGGYVHIDATYWGRGFGCLVAIDNASGRPLHLSFISSERVSDYLEAIEGIRNRGYEIKGIVVDGKKYLIENLKGYNVQMCQFHMARIVRRYLNKNPRLRAAAELNGLMATLPTALEEDFVRNFAEWKVRWADTLNRRTLLKSGKSRYRHRTLRSAMHSVEFFMPYLFTYQRDDCQGMPNTNNKIEGTFTDLKKNTNNHSGMSPENRKRFICGFFLAWDEDPRKRKAGPADDD